MLLRISPEDLDDFGGYKGLNFGSSSSFRIVRDGGRFYMADPDGNAFLVRGVNYVRFNGDLSVTGGSPYTEGVKAKYGSVEQWRKEVRRRLREWGFNTLGAWSDPELGLPYTLNLHITPNYYWSKGGVLARRRLRLAREPDVLWQPFRTFPDVYDQEFARVAREVARREGRRGDPNLVGYFTDNEVDFNVDVIFYEFADMTPQEPGKRALIDFLGKQFEVRDFNAKFGTKLTSLEDLLDYTASEFQVLETRNSLREVKVGFALQVAKRYAEVCVGAVREADPGHLVLGARFAGENARDVLASFSPFDVISNNYYGENPPLAYFSKVNRLTGRPTLLSEFSFRGPGMPNTRGAGIVVGSQGERGEYVKSWITHMLELDHFLGYLWWEYMDEPREGRRPDAEDSNYGLVDLEDVPYAQVVEAFMEVNYLFPKTA